MVTQAASKKIDDANNGLETHIKLFYNLIWGAASSPYLNKHLHSLFTALPKFDNKWQDINWFSHISMTCDEVYLSLWIHEFKTANTCLREIGSMDASKDNW